MIATSQNRQEELFMDAKLKCYKCGFYAEPEAKSCPNCGADLTKSYTDPLKKKRIFWGIVGGLIIAVVAIGGIIYTMSNFTFPGL